MHIKFKCRMYGGPCFSPSEFFLTYGRVKLHLALRHVESGETVEFIQSTVAQAVTEAQGNLLGNLDQLISSVLESFQNK